MLARLTYSVDGLRRNRQEKLISCCNMLGHDRTLTKLAGQSSSHPSTQRLRLEEQCKFEQHDLQNDLETSLDRVKPCPQINTHTKRIVTVEQDNTEGVGAGKSQRTSTSTSFLVLCVCYWGLNLGCFIPSEGTLPLSQFKLTKYRKSWTF